MPGLTDPPYLAFPLSVGRAGPLLADLGRHVRDQIEQVLLTNPGERVFRPEFGAGVQALVFEPDAPALRELTRTRLLASLAEALAGEVDPRSLAVVIEPSDGGNGRLEVLVSFTLATIDRREQHRLLVGPEV